MAGRNGQQGFPHLELKRCTDQRQPCFAALAERDGGEGLLASRVSETCVSYLVSLLVSALLLWTKSPTFLTAKATARR